MVTSCNLFWIVFVIFLGVVAFLIHNGCNINVFVKKDTKAKELDASLMAQLINKYPDVKPEFILLPEREQNIENNQEIHEINVRLYDIEKSIEEIRRTQRGGL